MLKYPAENNWANNVLDLHHKYNLPQNDDNIADVTWPVCGRRWLKTWSKDLLL